MGLLTALLASEVSLFDMNSWWWAICKGMYWVINCIEEAYGYLVGLKTISNNAGSDAPQEVSDILFLNITNSAVQQAFLYFFIAAAGILLIFLAIGMIKASFQDNDQLASRGKMVEKSFQAFFIMLLLPVIMYVGVVACGAFIRLISSIMQTTLHTEGASIAENIHQTCLPVGIENASEIHWNCTYDTLKSAQIFNEKGDFVNTVNNEYQYVLAMLASGILIYVLIAICTSLVERLIEVVFFYLIGPFVLARTPLDDGGSFKLWKDIIIAKMLSAAGVIISMYLYFILMQNINSWFVPAAGDNDATIMAKGMVRILFCIGGAFASKKGALSIAQVISSNTGISEGMSQGQSLHMLSSGLNLGMSAIRGGMMGFAMAGKAGGGGTTAALRGATSGNGKFSAPPNTSDKLGAANLQASGASSARTLAAAGAGAIAQGGVGAGSASTFAAAGGGAGAVAQGGAIAAGGGAGAIAHGGGTGGGAASMIDNAGNASGANYAGGESSAANADSGDGGQANAESAWTKGVLDNPNAPGNLGKLNQARAAGGGLTSAFLYGGGLIGGAISAGAYLTRKAVGLATKPIKWGAKKIGGAINKSRPVQAAKGRAVELKEKGKAGIENMKQQRTAKKADKLNSSLDKLIDKVNAREMKIDKRYGGLGSESVNKIKQAQLSSQVRSIDKRVKKLTSAGVANTNVLDRANKMLGSGYKNSEKPTSTPKTTGK